MKRSDDWERCTPRIGAGHAASKRHKSPRCSHPLNPRGQARCFSRLLGSGDSSASSMLNGFESESS